MDEKGAKVVVPTREEVVVLIRIKGMYVRVLKNHLSLTIVKRISIDSKAIPLLIIVPSILSIETWFYEKMIGYKLVTVSSTSYTNKGIYMT
jgi:hypothetical protein